MPSGSSDPPCSTSADNDCSGRIVRHVHLAAALRQIRNSGQTTKSVRSDDLDRRRGLVLAGRDGLTADDHHERVVVVLERAGVVVTQRDLLRGAVAAAVAGQLFTHAFHVAAAASLRALAPGRPVGPLAAENDV